MLIDEIKRTDAAMDEMLACLDAASIAELRASLQMARSIRAQLDAIDALVAQRLATAQSQDGGDPGPVAPEP